MREADAKTRYALAAALDLAEHYAPEEPVKLQAIAARTHAPANYLVQILLRLKRGALVNSTRGAQGGYWLMRRPELISVAEIIAALSDDHGTGVASDASPYDGAIEALWVKAERQREAVLAGTSLADLLRETQSEG